MRVSVALGIAVLVASLGCAPSHRMVHDGNVYFEDCYGGDFNPQVTDARREQCWNAWLAFYTRHQPAHRIDYAMRRVEALQSGEPPLGLPGITPGTPLEAEDESGGLVTVEGPRAGAEAATLLDRHAVAEGVPHGCQAACAGNETQCLEKCPPDVLACRDICMRDRAICLHGCY
jgi:hypothetical protein